MLAGTDDNGEEHALNGDSPVLIPSDRCPRCGGRVEPNWSVCGWCGQPTDPDGSTPPEMLESSGEPDRHPSVELTEGTALLGRYRIEALLGRGGFGITYRARDLRLDRDVAIKELFPPGAMRQGTDVAVAPENRPDFAGALARFQREAASLARFNHPGIVQIFEVFEANRTAYLVMELIEGPSVGQLLQQRGTPLGVDEVLDVVLRAGGALGAVHAAGLLHRDINPSNIMVDGTYRIVLIDFGLARRFGDESSGNLTRAVTPGYAPPEQYAGSAASGPPCDVFGLAATAYKLLTGTTPANVFDRQTGGELLPPHVLRPEVPPLVSAGILDGMELDPAHRPANTDAFLNRLGLFGTTPRSEVILEGIAVRPPDATMPVVPAAETPRPAEVSFSAVVVAPIPEFPVDPAPVQIAPVGSPVPSPGARAPFAPWHDGAPPVVGPVGRWRGWVTWPVGVALTALASASPLVICVVVAYLIIPLLATAGDREVARHRIRTGAPRRRWDDVGPAVFYPVRYVRNLAVGIARSLPAAAVAAIGIATVGVLVDGAIEPVLVDLAIRTTGIAMALMLLLPLRRAGRGFRAELGIAAAATWSMQGRRRPSTRVAVVWAIAVAMVAIAALLQPELWPLG